MSKTIGIFKVLDNDKTLIEIHNAINKRQITFLKKHLIDLACTISTSNYSDKNYKTKIIATYIDPLDKNINNIDIDICTLLFNQEIHIIMKYVDGFHQMKIIPVSHTFSFFSTDFLESTIENKLRIINNGECWSPTIGFGVMYTYFVNFFREYLECVDNYFVTPTS